MRWLYYPKDVSVPQEMRDIINAFEKVESCIESSPYKNMASNKVLECVRPELETLGYMVEKGKKKIEKIHMPVHWDENGLEVLAFDLDAYHSKHNIIIEVEAGRAVSNYQFLKDFFEACMVENADYLCIAVRNVYRTGNSLSKDYDKVIRYFESLFQNKRIKFELKGVLVIGY